MVDQNEFYMSLRYTLGRFVFKFHKIRMGDDVIMMSFKFSPNSYPYLKFYSVNLQTWNQYTTIQRPSNNDLTLFEHDLRSRSQLKVKGHRCGSVCVL